MNCLRQLACVVVASGLLASVARTQTRLLELHGAHPDDYLGASSVGLGDLDGDGTPDFAVAAIREDTFASEGGVVRVYSGATAAVIATLHGGANDIFGATLVDGGDLDGDGLHELLIGAPHVVSAFAFGPGHVYVVSPAGWTTIRTFGGGSGGSLYGFGVSGNVDVDADGVPDVIVGDYAFMNFVGAVDVYSGATGALLHHLLPPNPDGGAFPRDAFGESTAGVSDVDGDGHDDVLVGAPSGGYARLYSGATGAELRAYTGTPPTFGIPVLNAGDLDGDGVDEHAVADFTSAISIYSGATGALIRAIPAPPTPGGGLVLSNPGDLDGDAVPDLLVSSSTDTTAGPSAGSVRAYSGATGAAIVSVFGTAGELLGYAYGVGDLDADGRPDFCVGLENPATGSGSYAGAARVYSLASASVTTYCTAKPNTTCTPFVGYSGEPSFASSLPFRVHTYHTLNKKSGLLFYGSASAGTPFQGGWLCVQPPIKRTVPASSNGDSTGSNCSGGYSFDFGALLHSGLDASLVVGADVRCQFWIRDPAASSGTSLTDAVAFTLAP